MGLFHALAGRIRGMAEKRSGSGCCAVVAVVTALLLPSLYVLSIGPSIWMVHHDYLPTEILVAYLPVNFLMEKWEWFGFVMWKYLNLWVPNPIFYFGPLPNF